MDSAELARRCLKRLNGHLTLEDQWIPPLPADMVTLCQEAGIEALPSKLLAYFCDGWGVTVTVQSLACTITIPDQPDADALYSICATVPLTLLPPIVEIIGMDGRCITASARHTACRLYPSRSRYPYIYEYNSATGEKWQ